MKKRRPLSFDPEYFKKLKQNEGDKSNEEIFKLINERNHWAASSKSGPGSDDEQTAEIRKRLPQIIDEFNVKTLLDLPCGDFNWLSKVDLNLSQYIGGDIIKSIIEHNQKAYANSIRTFEIIDIINDSLPIADLLFCRDCLVHFSFADVGKAIDNIKKSNITYLMTTTFTECAENQDIVTGDWRVLNLEKAPFNFPAPLYLINERCTEGEGTYGDKCLGIWSVKDL